MSFVEKRNGDFVSGAHFVQEVKRRLLRKGLAVVRAHALLALHACTLEPGALQHAPRVQSADAFGQLPTDHFKVADRYGLFVGGEFREPVTGEHFATINPATEQQLSEVALAGPKDVDDAVSAARKALVEV